HSCCPVYACSIPDLRRTVYSSLLSFTSHRAPLALHSFPTRRSSDLAPHCAGADHRRFENEHPPEPPVAVREVLKPIRWRREEAADRKSTRLNSSHGSISYAVFCLKKKTQHDKHSTPTTR